MKYIFFLLAVSLHSQTALVRPFLSFPNEVNRPALLAAIDPRSFGAKCDGVTNDATALQNAIAASYGGVLSLPNGATCAFASQLNITSALTVQGYGATLKKTARMMRIE